MEAARPGIEPRASILGRFLNIFLNSNMLVSAAIISGVRTHDQKVFSAAADLLYK